MSTTRDDNNEKNSEKTVRERQNENLRPWQPGQSGNPNGRPKESGIRYWLKKYADEIPIKEYKTRGELLADNLWKDALKKKASLDRTMSRKIVIEQVEGRPPQAIQIDERTTLIIEQNGNQDQD